ncbi:hypothetical protein [Streptomyces reniochalinae]|nr:hypothetical protein [Streptomyces reniochalinae]
MREVEWYEETVPRWVGWARYLLLGIAVCALTAALLANWDAV